MIKTKGILLLHGCTLSCIKHSHDHITLLPAQGFQSPQTLGVEENANDKVENKVYLSSTISNFQFLAIVRVFST